MTSEPLTSIRTLVERLNQAWLAGRYDELEPLFHPTAVLVGPGFTGRVEGRAACVQSYRDFGAAAKVEAFEIGDLMIEAWGAAAVVSCPFAITYQLNDVRYEERGRDLLVLVNEDGAWRIAWRTLIVESTARA